MKLGIFDSGLGGLLIAKAVLQAIPNLDIIYAGDTLHLPYGNRSPEAIYNYSRQSIEFLFEEDCALIIVACNTASAGVLRKIQQEYLPNSPYHKRRVLGVIVPTLECALERGHKNIGLIATRHTVQTNIYYEELIKIDPEIKLQQISAPLLVPMIENDGIKWIAPVLESYLMPLKESKVDSLILGCTHYSIIKQRIKEFMGQEVDILCQQEIIPAKLADYLNRHPEIQNKISKTSKHEFFVSDVTESYLSTAQQIYGKDIKIQKADFDIRTKEKFYK